MHPAPSVILFTTLSGAGFGLLAFLGLGMPAVTGWVAFGYFTLAYLMAVGGLLASTFHLGHPERALKAFTQWKTSWLSREAWTSVAALLVMALFGAGLVFLGTTWQPLGWIGAALSLLTVYSTSMIYAQLKTVPRWNMPLTPALFLVLSLTGGALLAGQGKIAAILLALAAVVQVAWWIKGDARFAEAGPTLGTATGLGSRGAVRAFEPPHTGTNYLLNEMGYQVGRKHAAKLRAIAGATGYAAPFLLVLLAPKAPLVVALAAVLHVLGVMASRWLFFAEAKHAVATYYGR